MLGDNLRNWFEIFDGIVVFRSGESGLHLSDGWINWSDIENRFKSQRLKFSGKVYSDSDLHQRERLLNAVVNFGDIFVRFKLLDKRRLSLPPSLDYRLTPFGRMVSNWGYGETSGLKKRALFLLIALTCKIYPLRKLISYGAFFWASLNAVKFYTAAANWIGNIPFALWSSAIIAIGVGVFGFIKGFIR